MQTFGKPKCADHHSACQRAETAEGAGDECEGEGRVHQCKIEIWPRHNSRKPPWCSRHYEELECKCCFGAAFPQHTDCMEPVGTVRCQSDLLPLQGGTGNTTFMAMAHRCQDKILINIVIADIVLDLLTGHPQNHSRWPTFHKPSIYFQGPLNAVQMCSCQGLLLAADGFAYYYQNVNRHLVNCDMLLCQFNHGKETTCSKNCAGRNK